MHPWAFSRCVFGVSKKPPHTHSKGWVAPHRGCYDDALRIKRNEVELCVHDPLGGGFSPPAVKALHKRDKRARVYDRTNYTGRTKMSFRSHHAQRISLAAVKGDGDMVATAALRLKSKLDLVLRGVNPPGA